MTSGRSSLQPFQREVRHFVVGGLLFVLFLAGAALVGLREATGWALVQHEKRIAAETLALAGRLVDAGSAGALSTDARAIELLRQFSVLQAAVYDRRGTLGAQAAFLPWGAAVPLQLAEKAPGAEPAVERTDLDYGPAIIARARLGADGSTLRLVFDGSAVARARWAGNALTAGVAVTALLLGWLTIPFLRKLLRPIEELAETARHAGALVPPAAGDRGDDEPREAVATFARTIEELRKRSEEVGMLRLRELAALGEMSAGIAHEFRNATATILGYVRLADGNVGEPSRKRHLEAIRTEAEHVARVTGDFLFFARPGALDAQPTDLDELVREVVAEESLSGEKVDYQVEGTFGEAAVDPLLVRRALVNLLRNAAEAASSGVKEGRVLVRAEQSGELVAIAVEDDGPGVPPDEAPRLFVPFHSTKDSGTGLGLALVARIAALHGGVASQDSSPRLGGARFLMTLRREAPRPASPPSPPPLSGGPSASP